MNNLIKTVDNAKPSPEDGEIVRKHILVNSELKSMQIIFLNIIATLENDFMKEEVCCSIISLLKSRSNYDNDINRVREFVSDKSSVPRNLRLKVKLTGRASIVRTQEFLALEENLQAADTVWQKHYKNAFRQVRELERNDSGILHTENFFKILEKLVKMKAIFEIKKLIPSKQKVFKKGFESLAAAAWVSIFIEMDSSFSNKVNTKVSNTIDLTRNENDINLPSDNNENTTSSNATSTTSTLTNPTSSTSSNPTSSNTTSSNSITSSETPIAHPTNSTSPNPPSSNTTSSNFISSSTTRSSNPTSSNPTPTIPNIMNTPPPLPSSSSNQNGIHSFIRDIEAETVNKEHSNITTTTIHQNTNLTTPLPNSNQSKTKDDTSITNNGVQQKNTKRVKTSSSYYDWMSDLSSYINLDTEKIRERIFLNLNEEEGLDLLVIAENDNEKLNIILRLHTFISFFIPIITSYTANIYNTNRREREAAAEALAAVKTAEIEDTTKAIAEIVNSEESMSCKYMKDYVSKDVTKKVNKALSKNVRGGKKVVFADAPSHIQKAPSNSPNQLQRNKKSNSSTPKAPSPIHMNRDRWVSPKFKNKWRRSDTHTHPDQTQNPQYNNHQDRERTFRARNQRHHPHPAPPPSSNPHVPSNYRPSPHNQQQRLQHNNNKGTTAEQNSYSSQGHKKRRRQQNNQQRRDHRDE